MAAQKRPMPFAEWRPDVALLDTQFAADVENVFAGTNSYLPFPSLLPFSLATLPGACGLFSARGTDGEWKIFGGTPTGLYQFTMFAGWTDVSRVVGGDYNVTPGDLWMFEVSGPHLIAVNANDDPQVFDLDAPAGSKFTALGGSPPRATNVKQMGDFLVLSGLPATPRQIIWSGINDITHWTIGLNLCDMQEFPDGGPVQGVAGAEIGYVVQDRAIRTMQFLPGDTTFIFNFSRVLHDRGSISKYGFNAIGNVLYFVSEDGFYTITGQQVTPIGADKVNEWWLANTDLGRRNVIHCITGINKPRVVWVMHNSTASPMYDRQMIFDWSNGRWTKTAVSALVWGMLATVTIDLDTDDPGDPLDPDLDSATFGLDSFAYIGGRPFIGAIDQDGRLGTPRGPNLPATLETAEAHLVPGARAFVSDAYPLDDALNDATGTVAAGTRERLQDAPVWNPPVTIEITGSAALFSSARLHRFRRFIPRATVWTHAQGVVIEVQQDGSVA
jgi:hypothetical protein